MHTVLVTGGTGYIGSHTCVELLNCGYEVIIVDDLSNSSSVVIDRISQITGKTPKFYKLDIALPELDSVFTENAIDAVIHFAGFKAVGESVSDPLKYYTNNIGGTLNLCNCMKKHGVNRIVFSSSATVYGENAPVPYVESFGRGVCSNPYGWTKWMIEQILTDMSSADINAKVTLLRYFNPIGAHPSGLIGEDPKGIPNNLLPYVAKVAVGKLEYMDRQERLEVFNLGTGRGSSVLEVVAAFEKACGRKIKYEIKPRRAGDLAAYWCDPLKAREMLGFTTKYNLDDCCRDTWRWQENNPDGYLSFGSE